MTKENWKEIKIKNTTKVLERVVYLKNKEIKLIEKEIEELFKLNPKTLLIKSNGKPLNKKSNTIVINGYLEKYSKHFNKKIQSHSFRIGLIKNLFEKGIKEELIKEIVGHKRIETTRRYNKQNKTK